MFKSIVQFLIRWCEKNDKVQLIKRGKNNDEVYLVRYKVFKTRWVNIYIHRFLRSDLSDLHDHPWYFLTYLVEGAYTEHKWNEKTQQVDITRRTVEKNRLVFRKPTDQHQVVVDRDLNPSELGEAALTFFVSGPILRDWGFIKEIQVMGDEAEWNPFCKPITVRKWIYWEKYLGLK